MNGKPAQAPHKGSARERLLAAADELFYENGINTVGIDRVIERAGVAKASLYDCFGSKDELIRSYLEMRNEARKVRLMECVGRYDTPEQKILGVFDMLGDLCSQPNYRGCAFMRAGVDGNASEKVKEASDHARALLLDQFTSLARAAGAANPELLGQQLVLLYDGASIAAHLDRNRNAAGMARNMAEQMLASACEKKKAAARPRI